MSDYVLTVALPGCLPEVEPMTISVDDELPVLPQLLSVAAEEVLHLAPDPGGWLTTGEPDAWDALISTMEKDRANASGFSEEGFSYELPNGYILDVSRVEE